MLGWPRCSQFESFMHRTAALISKAIDGVIVHESGGLHKCIASGRPYESKAFLEKVFAHRGGHLCARRKLVHFGPGVLDRSSADEGPDVVGERLAGLAEFKHPMSIVDRRLDL